MASAARAQQGQPPRVQLVAAFAAVYLVWGSTYLAIRYAIESMPPFLMAGMRFVVAGALLYGWTRLRGAPRPTLRHWRATGIAGALLLLGGNGGVVWAEQYVASGVAALLVATVPFWMVLLDWARPGGERPHGGVVLGLLLGFAGLALLVGPGEWAGGGGIHPLGAAALMLATFSWAMGSIYSRGAELPASPLQATGMEMLAGGALQLLAAALTGEMAAFAPAAVTTRSLLALLYLVVFGSLIGFTAYVWLLGVTTTARVSTYAYVNPVVAVLLGWAVAGEALTARMGVAMAVILASVALITVARARAGQGVPDTAEAAPLPDAPARPARGAAD